MGQLVRERLDCEWIVGGKSGTPSHHPESYENTTMLRFTLDGVQYAAGDLKCDDSSPKK